MAEIQSTSGKPYRMKQFITEERGRLKEEAAAEQDEWFYGLRYLTAQLEMTWKSLIFKVSG